MPSKDAHQGVPASRLPRVLSWNAGKANMRDDYLSIFLENSPSFDIISVSEPGTRRASLLKSSHAVISCLDLLVYYNPHWSASVISNVPEASIILLTAEKDLSILCCYLRDGSSTAGIRAALNLLHDRTDFLLIGDLNCNMGDRPNSAGLYLEEFLCGNPPFQLINDMKPTFHRAGVPSSMLDICLVSGVFADGLCQTEDSLNFSDHLGISFLPFEVFVESKSEYAEHFPLRSRNLHRVTDGVILRSFSSHLESILAAKPPSGDWYSLRRDIISAIGKSGINTKPKLRKEPTSQISAAARALVRQRKSCVRFGPEYRSLTVQLRRQLRRDRHSRWDAFVSTIQAEDSPFALFRKSQGRPRISCSPAEGFKILREAFDNPLPQDPSIVAPAPDVTLSEQSFSASDLSQALKGASSSSAPGPDGLPYLLFKVMGPTALSHLLAVLNQWFTSGLIPDGAFLRLMIGIPKPDGGTRGLTLTNSILKIFERLVLPSLETSLQLPDYQFGFRKGGSSSAQALRLITTMQANRDCLVIFYDLKKAFDRVDRTMLLADLSAEDLDPRIYAAVHALMQPAPARIVVGDSLSEEFEVSSGVPQGGILSPLLFNYFISRLHLNLKIPAQFRLQLYAYADDIAVSLAWSNLQDLFHIAELLHGQVNAFFNGRRLEINLKKSGVLLKTLQRPMSLPILGPSMPPLVRQYKYLGCLIDDKLNLKAWCDALVRAIKQRLVLIKRLSVSRRLSRHQIEQLYSAIIRGKLNYACSIWPRSVHSHKVLTTERGAQGICFGALLGTYHHRIETESNLIAYSDIICRSDLRLVLAIRSRSIFQDLLDSMDHFLHPLADEYEHTFLYDIGYTPYRCGILEDAFDAKAILEKFPRRVRQPARRSFKNELTLARYRLGCIPSREWATKLGLTDNSLCRHCACTLETDDHLLQCSSLAHIESLPATTMDELRDILSTRDRGAEDTLLRFISHNDLFRLGGVAPPQDHSPPPQPSTQAKRKAAISPIQQSPKRSRRHGVRRSLSSTLSSSNGSSSKRRRKT